MDNLKKLGFNELYFLIFPDEKKLIENHLMKFHNKEKLKFPFYTMVKKGWELEGQFIKILITYPKFFGQCTAIRF